MKTKIEILVSLLLAYVAYQNYRINKATLRNQRTKLRLELFERRHAIFKALQKLFGNGLQHGIPTRDALSEYDNQTSDAEFLFGKDIKEYLDEISTRTLKAIHNEERLERGNLEQTEIDKLADEIEKFEIWLSDQYEDSRAPFRKYLHFSIDKDF